MAHTDLSFGPAQEADIDPLASLLSHGFGFPQDDAKGWFERAKHENLRVLHRGTQLVGGLLEIPMAQYFAGRSVSTMGVAGVGVAIAERGRGVGAHLMTCFLRGARERGFALSTLYPASVVLYRRVGYERAGARFAISFDPREQEIAREPGMTITEVRGTPEDVVALYRATAPRSNGYLDRGPYVWARVSEPRGFVTKTFTIAHGDRLEGYVVVSHTADHVLDATAVRVSDLAATTARAARAILRLLVEYRSLAKRVEWFGGPSDLFTNLLPERHCEVRLLDYFMVRILDVAGALGARGWPRGASGSLAFELADKSLTETSGRYTLALEDGRAKVTAGGTDVRVVLDERALAALYSGYAPASTLVDAGFLQADAETAAQLDAWFSTPFPTMRDMF